MTARHCVAGAAQVFRQIFLHLRCRLERHGVQVRIKLRQQAHAVSLHHPGVLDASPVISEALLWRQAGHADIDTRFTRHASRIGRSNFAQFACGRVQQHHVNMMVMRRRSFRAMFPERSPLQSPANHAWM